MPRLALGCFARLLLMMFGLAFALIVTEIALQFIQPPLAEDRVGSNQALEFIAPIGLGWAQLFQSAPRLGWEHKPNMELVQQNWSLSTTMRTNSDGLYDLDYSQTPPPNTYRIILLGDSYAEGAHVERELTYQQVAEDCLNARLDDRQYEILNLGVSAYGPSQYLTTLRQKGLAYQPDLVMVSFYPGNDYTDELGNTFSDYVWGVPVRYVPDDNGNLREIRYELTLQNAQPSKVHQWLYDHTALYRLYTNYITEQHYFDSDGWLGRLRGWGIAPPLPGIPDTTPEEIYAVMGQDNHLILDALEAGEEPLLLTELAARVEAILAQIQVEARDAGADFALIVMPLERFTITPQAARIADSHAMPYLDLTLPMSEQTALLSGQPPEDYTMLPDGHFNIEGHALAGEILCAWLVENRIMQG